jgi:hypothetical protein
MRGRNLRALLVALAGFGISAPASASFLVGHWLDGVWQCTIDGRPARMRWQVVDDPQASCSGDWCTSAALVRRKGSFSDNGSRWVPLLNLRDGQERRGAFFDHADGNRWYLRKPNSSGRAVGHTVWQGTQYPLICWR